jgi:hypothetical protein
MHQQWICPLAPAATAQQLGSRHSGQRSGSGGMAAYTAAVTTISIFHSGLASLASTVARDGGLVLSTH